VISLTVGAQSLKMASTSWRLAGAVMVCRWGQGEGSVAKATTFRRVWDATGKWRMWAPGPMCMCWFVAL